MLVRSIRAPILTSVLASRASPRAHAASRAVCPDLSYRSKLIPSSSFVFVASCGAKRAKMELQWPTEMHFSKFWTSRDFSSGFGSVSSTRRRLAETITGRGSETGGVLERQGDGGGESEISRLRFRLIFARFWMTRHVRDSSSVAEGASVDSLRGEAGGESR